MIRMRRQGLQSAVKYIEHESNHIMIVGLHSMQFTYVDVNERSCDRWTDETLAESDVQCWFRQYI